MMKIITLRESVVFNIPKSAINNLNKLKNLLGIHLINHEYANAYKNIVTYLTSRKLGLHVTSCCS